MDQASQSAKASTNIYVLASVSIVITSSKIGFLLPCMRDMLFKPRRDGCFQRWPYTISEIAIKSLYQKKKKLSIFIVDQMHLVTSMLLVMMMLVLYYWT